MRGRGEGQLDRDNYRDTHMLRVLALCGGTHCTALFLCVHECVLHRHSACDCAVYRPL